jgi:2-polyprenyl-3-methyl-5-hydroxy-6-metoxy-1,4-benzoquinol methylase
VRYGIRPVGVLERAALLAGVVPVPLIDALIPLVQTRAMMAGVRLGVFEAIGQEARTTDEVAKACKVDPEGLRLILRVLVSMGYVESTGEAWRLTGLAERCLLPGGEMDLHGYVDFNYAQWDFIAHMEQALETGQGLGFHRTMGVDDWRRYQQAMFELARTTAPVLASLVPVPPGATRLLDVAGAHGLHGAAICRAHPPMRATVLDLREALETARPLAAKEGFAGLVDHVEGDLMEDEWGVGFDVVLLSNIIHHFGPDENAAIARKARQALRVGGTVAIWDTEAPSDEAPAELIGDAGALYFYVTSSARAWPFEQIERWLRDAAFAQVKTLRPARAPGRVLVTGTRVG